MKKLLLLVAVVAMLLPGCQKINDALDELDGRLDKLEQEAIPTIDEQIAAINLSLTSLDAMDKELKGYIDGLTAAASNLQEQIDNTNTKIGEVKATLQGEISTAKAAVLAQLDAVKTELEGELAQINTTIATLQAKDEELDGKIADLKTYVDTKLGNTTDWVNATFATLEQYNGLVQEIATIKVQIEALNKSVSDLETKLTTKINNDIASAVATLNADIQQKVSEITTAYTNAVKTAKEEITAAYTVAIQTAISSLDASLKAWVGEQLAGYYTIAQIDAKITALNNSIVNGDDALQQELNTLKNQLTTTANEITTAYKKAINDAINTNNGVINSKIANEIATVNNRINSEVATINAKLATLQAQVDKNTADIAKLLARIQSVSYIPRYDDNKATLKYAKRVSQVDIDFEISPKDAVEELAKVWQSAVSVKAVYTETRAVSFVDMPIVRFEADEQNGVITITASGENLEQVVSSAQKASLALDISDGNNSITSAYIPLVAKEVDILDLFVPSNEIWYTSTDDNIVEPTRPDAFDVSVISNTIKDGMGILKFDGNVTKVYLYAFCNQETQVGAENLETIKFPNGLAEIGEYAFCNCTSLAEVLVPPTLTRSKTGVFENCDNLKRVDIYDLSAWFRIAFNHTSGNPMYNGAKLYLNGEEVVDLIIPSDITTIPFATLQHCASIKSVVIPDGVTLVRANAFRKCANLATVYCKPTTPPSISFSSANTWLAFSDNARGRMIYVPRQSVEAYKSADGWKDYADYIVGYDF